MRAPGPPPGGGRPPWGSRKVAEPHLLEISARMASATPPRGRSAGFTLIEVLVALAIVALTLGAGLKVAGAMTFNAQRLGDVSAAQWCADNALANLRLGRRFPGTGDSDFACHQLGRDFTGRLVTAATPNPNFRRVDARVLDEQGHVLVSIATIIGRY